MKYAPQSVGILMSVCQCALPQKKAKTVKNGVKLLSMGEVGIPFGLR